MSAHSRTTWTLVCDAPGCREQIGPSESTRAYVRSLAVRRGWAIKEGVGPLPMRDDYCPQHKTPETRDG